tara:strand:+ start:119 stop:478 length:360 start_codon:yes stop_codon:yes gene_type:complete
MTKKRTIAIAHEKARNNKFKFDGEDFLYVGKNFYMVFANGWEVSVSYMSGAKATGRKMFEDNDTLYASTDTAEVMIKPPSDKDGSYLVNEFVTGYYDEQTSDQIAQHIARTQSYPKFSS